MTGSMPHVAWPWPGAVAILAAQSLAARRRRRRAALGVRGTRPPRPAPTMTWWTLVCACDNMRYAEHEWRICYVTGWEIRVCVSCALPHRDRRVTAASYFRPSAADYFPSPAGPLAGCFRCPATSYFRCPASSCFGYQMSCLLLFFGNFRLLASGCLQ